MVGCTVLFDAIAAAEGAPWEVSVLVNGAPVRVDLAAVCERLGTPLSGDGALGALGDTAGSTVSLAALKTYVKILKGIIDRDVNLSTSTQQL